MQAPFAGPIAEAWERMRKALFLPFDPGKWFILAFAAWLSRLGQSGGGAPGGNWPGDRAKAQALVSRVSDVVERTVRNPLWLSLAIVAIVIVLAFSLALCWVNSRGKFVFLDAVVRDRVAIAEAWSTYARQANSLFLWRIAYGIIALAGHLAMLAWAWVSVVSPWLGNSEFQFLACGRIAAVWVPLIVVGTYIGHFLESFVVPIMYRDRLRTNAAWARFLSLFWGHPGAFLLYGLMVLGILFVLGIAALVVGCLTCCIGFLLLSVPYLWAVLLLPLLYAYRALGPLFLAQFGPDWSVFRQPEPDEPAAPQAPTA